MAPIQQIQITSDEINRLIYSYFRDSGFEHSAYTLVKEAQLERSAVFKIHVPRGELVELLSKALLYTEVECHFNGSETAVECKAKFSLLESHTCSPNPPESHSFIAPIFPPPVIMSAPPVQTNGVFQDSSSTKRKSSPPPRNVTPAEKRPRKEANDMDVDTPEPEPKPKAGPSNKSSKAKNSKKQRVQGPADDVTDPNAITLLSGHTTEVFVCAFNPVKYNLLASGSKDAVVKIWKLPDPTNPSAPAEDPVTIDYFSKEDARDLTCLSWNSAGTLLAIASYDCKLRICDIAGSMYYENDKHQGPIFTTRFSPSGRWLLTASLDGTSCLWDVAGKRLHRQYSAHEDCCLDVDWINDNMFASCGADRQVHIFSVDEDKAIKTFGGHTDEINQIKCNPSGTRLASCSDDMTTRIWNVSNISSSSEDLIPGLGSTSDKAILLEGHRHSVSTIGWYRLPGVENELIATGSFDGATRLWDSVTGRCLHAFSDHARPVYALDISPNNQWLTTGGGDGWLHIYDLRSYAKLWSWFAGAEKPGVFEIHWQTHNGNKVDRIGMALECRAAGVVDLRKVPAIANAVRL
ncbi:WD40-repeat-containing domain protein [Rhodocollybia butyracea]|uniref:WD40-repeat-containing domain protein n=1 Tax=Rhodocollybia butyracea TaxID=206335 RepID=A0A9P5Q3T8_9AGAR|nr:WD40-repeat-containing domain protein [Rhodocollybia butyracea]